MRYEDFRDLPHAITLLGMSGVGKTVLSSMLRRDSNWFHYSADYRIGTRYLCEHIVDNIKFKIMSMTDQFVANLLRSDSIYINHNITVDNLEPVSTFLGMYGDPNLGGLDKRTFLERQELYRDAEVKSMRDVPRFIAKSWRLYGCANFINDASGSLCEVVDLEDPQDKVTCRLTGHSLIVYIRADSAYEEKLAERARAHPKPLFYNPLFIRPRLAEMPEGGSGIDPAGFAGPLFPGTAGVQETPLRAPGRARRHDRGAGPVPERRSPQRREFPSDHVGARRRAHRILCRRMRAPPRRARGLIMAIRLAAGLPATAELARETVPLFGDDRPAVRVLLVNLMPEKQKTERQIARKLGLAGPDVALELAVPRRYRGRNTDPAHLSGFYRRLDELGDERFDGVILTGAPIEQLEFGEVDYWPEICLLLDRVRRDGSRLLTLCWGAQAALHHYHGIPKHNLPEKRFGVFDHEIVGTGGPVSGLRNPRPDAGVAPHRNAAGGSGRARAAALQFGGPGRGGVRSPPRAPARAQPLRVRGDDAGRRVPARPWPAERRSGAQELLSGGRSRAAARGALACGRRTLLRQLGVVAALKGLRPAGAGGGGKPPPRRWTLPAHPTIP